MGMTILCIVATLGAAAGPTAGVQWRTNYTQAAQEARSAGKLLLVNVHTSWCGPCRQLQATTLRDPQLGRLIDRHCVALSLDGDANYGLLQRWGVQGFPTQLFIAPNGQISGRIDGYVDAGRYAASLMAAVSRAGLNRPSPSAVASRSSGQTRTPEAATHAQPNEPLYSATASLPKTDPNVRPCDMAVPLALSGYCPVSMIERAELAQGDDAQCLVYKGRRYRFQSDAFRSKFSKNPGRYLPAANGRCLVQMVDHSRATTGRIELPALYEDQLYLFSSATNRKKFLQDPEHYVSAWKQVAGSNKTHLR